MKTSTAIGVVVVLVVVLGAYLYWLPSHTMLPMGNAGINGSPNQGNLGQPDGTSPQQPPTGDGTGVSQNLILGINVTSSLGQYLSAYNGMTVYTYSPDTATPGASACTGQCAVNWPPYTVASADDIHVSSATEGTVGTITRADGSLQVTYNGKPLYFYNKDKQPGDALGQGVGGVWFVVMP